MNAPQIVIRIRRRKSIKVDEHFFTRRKGYATTLCDLRHRKVYDVVLGRSEASLEAYFQRLEGKAAVRVVCMDLASCYRALVKKHFPHARIVAARSTSSGSSTIISWPAGRTWTRWAAGTAACSH